MLPKILLGAGVFALLFSVLIFSCKIPIGKCKPGAEVRGEVVIWGTLPETEMNSVVQAYNPQAKTYAVRYTYVPEANFNQKLLEALASGTGPDMILAPYQSILSQEERIFVYPIASYPEKNFKDTYVDGASVLFTPGGALAFPVSIEPMVLFYNRTLLSKHGIVNPPSYWGDIVSIAPSLTVRQNGRFLESAIALGSPTAPYTKDILMSIVAQLGQTPVVRTLGPDGQTYFNVQANLPVTEDSVIYPLATASRYVTQFADPGQQVYSWNDSLGEASDMFVGEKLAMYIGYSGEYATLRARNPRAEIQMTYLPQTKDYNTFVMGMRMYAIATLKSSKNLQAALTTQAQFAGPGVSPTIAGITGGVPALRSYAGTQGLDPVVARSMLVARGWYDSREEQSTFYVASMIAEIVNRRAGVNDAVNVFISRLRDLYTKR